MRLVSPGFRFRAQMRRQIAEVGRRLLDYAYQEEARGDKRQRSQLNIGGVGALGNKQKKLITLGVAIASRRGGSISHYVREALLAGASEDEVLDGIAVAARMAGDPAAPYAAHALEAVRFFCDGEDPPATPEPPAAFA